MSEAESSYITRRSPDAELHQAARISIAVFSPHGWSIAAMAVKPEAPYEPYIFKGSLGPNVGTRELSWRNIRRPLFNREIQGHSDPPSYKFIFFLARETEPRRSSRRARDIESDGTQYGRDRDAPGQSCVYIPPLEHNVEFQRLATFSRYPDETPIRVTDLAAAGFYYTGFKDRVKCFSCGMAVENWVAGDDGMDLQWHRTDCPLRNGFQTMNDPLPVPNFRSLLREYKGIGNPMYLKQNGAALARAGMARNAALVSGPMDITDVTSNFGRVRLSESSAITHPAVNIANVVVPEHENLLRRINLRSEAERRKTFSKWPSYPAPLLPGKLAKDGFFYLGNLDRCQCFSCGGVLRNWTSGDNVREQHSKHFPTCKIIRSQEYSNIAMSENERQEMDQADQARFAELNATCGEPPDPSPEEQRRLAQRYPCRDAVNRHMQSLERRIETFDSRWPKSGIRATPEQIAKAGFYYLGESDKTKCFYCNGGLQNWDLEDEPWTEHAKWFPGCEFVLRKKGIQFVKRLFEAHPNLNRPQIRNPASYRDIPPSQVGRTTPPQLTETRTPINIKEVIDMGFSKARIDEAIRRKGDFGGYANTEELIQDLLERSDEETSRESGHSEVAGQSLIPVGATYAGTKRGGEGEEVTTQNKKTRTESPGSSIEGSEMAKSLMEIEESTLCRQCKKNKAVCMLIPCGHLCACEDCKPAMKRCIICKTKVSSSMKVYRA